MRDFFIFPQDIGRRPLRRMLWIEHIQGPAKWICNDRIRSRYEMYRRAKHFRGAKPRPRDA